MHLATQKKYVFDFVPTLVCQLPIADLQAYFPVQFIEEEPLAAAEPSIGTAIELESGYQFALIYGMFTGSLEIFKPTELESEIAIKVLLEDVGLLENCITWRRGNEVPPK
jgi:hypothetical protein